jgi:hypothetical protein
MSKKVLYVVLGLACALAARVTEANEKEER